MDALAYGMRMLKPDTLKMVLHSGPPPPADQLAATLDEMQYRRIVKETPVPQDEELFKVYRAANGFYARMNDGQIVVGSTLSDACTAAQAQVAERVLLDNDDDGLNKVLAKPKGPWQRVT